MRCLLKGKAATRKENARRKGEEKMKEMKEKAEKVKAKEERIKERKTAKNAGYSRAQDHETSFT